MVTKYLNITKVYLRVGIVRLLEYRVNMLGYFLINILWQAQTVALTLLFVDRFQSIAGWGRYELLILSFTWGIIIALTSFVFFQSMSPLPNDIGNGNLDYLLTKPGNKLFLISIRGFGLNNLISALIYLGWV